MAKYTITEEEFSAMIPAFQNHYLLAINYYERIKFHRNPLELISSILKQLNDYILEIQQAEIMRHNDLKTSSYVPTKITEIWNADRRIRSLYNAIKIYSEQEHKNFISIAVHIAEFRAMIKLYSRLDRQIQNEYFKSPKYRMRHKQMKIPITKTVHPIFFNILSGIEFERLVFTHALGLRKWDSLEWIGQSGSDGGRDIWGVYKGQSYCYQCANYKRLTFEKTKNDLRRIIEENHIPDFLITVSGGNISSKLRERIKADANSTGISNITVWSGVELEENIRKDNPALLKRFFEGEPFPESEFLPKDYDFSKSHELLYAYCNTFKAICVPTMKDFVEFTCTLNEEPVQTESLTVSELKEKGAFIFGESGFGKSLLIRRLALEGIEKNYIPILLEAKYYETSLKALLNKGVQSFDFSGFDEVFKICETNRKSLMLVIDGLNECSHQQRAKLIQEAIYLANSTSIKLLFTTQLVEESLKDIPLDVIKISKPTTEIKAQIAAKFCTDKQLQSIKPILGIVNTCLEANIIGQLAKNGIEHLSRFAILETFVRKKLGTNSGRGMLFLSKIGETLSEKITFSLPFRELDNILKDLEMDDQDYQACIRTGLLSENYSKVSFSHEILFNFFAADSVIRFSNTQEQILSAIYAPKNHYRKALIFGAISDPEVLSQLLPRIEDSELLLDCAKGNLGASCQNWMKEKLGDICALISTETKNLIFEKSNTEFQVVNVIPNSIREWSKHEFALIRVLSAMLFSGWYLDHVCSVLDEMDATITAQKELLNQPETNKEKISRSDLFNVAFGGFSQQRFGVNTMFRVLNSGAINIINSDQNYPERIVEHVATGRLNTGRIYFLLTICNNKACGKILYPYVLNLLKTHWLSFPRLIRSEILHKIFYFNNSEIERLELVQALNEIHGRTRDIFESTFIFDALEMLGGLEEDTLEYEKTVTQNLKEALSKPLEQSSWEVAATIYNSQFDHPYNYAFTKVINALEQDDVKSFTLLALKGSKSAFFVEPLIIEAGKVLGAECCPQLIKWANNPLMDENMPQSSISACVISHVIWGKLNYIPAPLDTTKHSEIERALLACAQIYYWLNRTNLDETQITKECESAWKLLCSKKSTVAIESIHQISRSVSQSFNWQVFEGSSVIHLTEKFSHQLCIVARNSLNNISNQKSLYQLNDNSELICYAISILGIHGNFSDLNLLRLQSHDNKFGRDAVTAIKKIEERL